VNKNRNYIPPLVVLLLLCIFSALFLGSQNISFIELFNNQSNQVKDIVFAIRLPRVTNAITVGGLLSMAGLMIQNLVKNPLADPYILGLSGASASIQLLIIASGIIVPFGLFVFIGFCAALFSMLLLIKISSKKRLNTQSLLLSGVVIAFAYGAIISLILTLSPLSATKPILFWLMGDLSYSKAFFYPILLLLAGMMWAFKYHKELDLIARGEFFAQKSGVDTMKINKLLLITTSVFTALAVSMAGTIGFVGLVVPHISRMLVGNNHAKLIPISALIGAIVLLIADTIARTVAAPIQLPVGIFTALFGIPIFIALQRKMK